MEDIEELDDENCEVEESISFDLSWKCKSCEKWNTEWDIPTEKQIICICENCGKKYEYYYCPY